MHERFHADETVALSTAGTTQATSRLNQRQAASVEGVQQALEDLVVDVKTARDDGMKMPGREDRAYGDGAHLYEALTTGIAKRFANTEKETRSGATKSNSKGGKGARRSATCATRSDQAGSARTAIERQLARCRTR